VIDSEAATTRKRVWAQVLTGSAGVALLFSIFVTVEMFRIWQRMAESNPREHPRLIALRSDLSREPGSGALKEQIRREEVDLRDRYHDSDARLQQGAWLLLVGLSVFALAGRLAYSVRREAPVPILRSSTYDPDRRQSVLGRVAVLVMAACLVAAAATIPFLRDDGGATETARGIWPGFRGPGGLGVSAHAGVPLDFDAREGRQRNIRWKSVVPLPGLSSPVVWNERLFLTGGIPSTREVYCFDTLTGALLWRRSVSAGPESSANPPQVFGETGYAAPTPVTDGKHVWVLFANGDVACLDLFGSVAWCVSIGLPENMYGLAASPILFEDKLILQIDQEFSENDEARSALIALDAHTGSVVWKTPRDVASSWPSPIVVPTRAGPQIITCANPWTIAYQPQSGAEIWRVDCLEGDGGPSPGFAEGLVLAVNVGSPLIAIRADGKGDVTKSHVAWTWDDGLPDVCSPLAARGLVWLQSTDGWTTCLDARTGQKLWAKKHDMTVYCSPALCGDAIYLIGRDGKLVVFAVGREYRELATGHLGEACDASPAFTEGRMYVRGATHLFCMESTEP